MENNNGFFQIINNVHGANVYKNVNNIISKHLALTKCKQNIFYLKRCRTNEIFPQHLVNILKSLSFQSSITLDKFNNLLILTKNRILNLEIDDNYNLINKLYQDLIILKRTVKNKLEVSDFKILSKIIFNKSKRFRQK